MNNVPMPSLAGIFLCLFATFSLHAQVGINTDGSDPEISSMLDVKSSSKGILIPRLSSAERDAITSPADGLLIFNVSDHCFNYYSQGAWYKDCGRDLNADNAPAAIFTAGSPSYDAAQGIAVDAAGNTFVVGRYFDGFTLGDSTYSAVGFTNHLLAKMNDEQAVLWSWQTDEADLADVETDALGNAYVLGSTSSGTTINGTALPSQSGFVIKFDPDGNIVWLSYGSADSMGAEDLELGSDGTIAIGGNFKGNLSWGSVAASGNNVYGDFYLIKLDANGDPIWMNNSSSDISAFLYGLAVGTDGSVALGLEMEGITTIGTETFITVPDAYDGAVMKYNNDGSFAWVHRLEASTDDYMAVFGSVIDEAGNVYITGDISKSVTIGAVTLAHTGSTGQGFILKFDASGNALWGHVFESTESNFGWRMVELANGNIAVAGGFRGDFTFDAATYTSNTSDGFVLAYTSDGDPAWFTPITGASNESINDMEFANDGLHLTGSFQEELQIGDQIFSSTGVADWLIGSLSSSGQAFVYQNSLDDAQNYDLDATNEIQDLSFLGTQLSISGGNTVDLSGIDTDTDDQGIDLLSLSENILQISLEDDGQSTYELDLSPIDTNTDEQKIDEFFLNGTELNLSLENDGENNKTVDLSSLSTDNQAIDQFYLNGTTLNLSLENDGENNKTVDLSSLSTDNQAIDQFYLNGTTLNLSLENDGQTNKMVDLSRLDNDTDEQTIDQLSLNGTTLHLSLEGDKEADRTLDLASINTDDQTIDQFALSNDTLYLSLENDGTSAQAVDLGNLSKTFLQDADADTRIEVESTTDADQINFRTAGRTAMYIDEQQQVGIGMAPTARLTVNMGTGGTANAGAEHATSTHYQDNPEHDMWQSYTATSSGRLVQLELRFRNGSGDRTVSIYKGEGTDGELLGVTTADITGTGTYVVSFDFSGSTIEQETGEMYTIHVDERLSIGLTINSAYAGGTWMFDDEWDAYFVTYVEPNLPGFQVSNNGVTINDYTLPTSDGTDGQVLTTDGNGNVSWMDIQSSNFIDPGTGQKVNSKEDWTLNGKVADDLSQFKEAIGKLQAENKAQKAQIDQLQAQNEALQLQLERIDRLESMLSELQKQASFNSDPNSEK